MLDAAYIEGVVDLSSGTEAVGSKSGNVFRVETVCPQVSYVDARRQGFGSSFSP